MRVDLHHLFEREPGCNNFRGNTRLAHLRRPADRRAPGLSTFKVLDPLGRFATGSIGLPHIDLLGPTWPE